MRYGSMKVTQMPPVHAANLAANIGNTSYGVKVIFTKVTHDYFRISNEDDKFLYGAVPFMTFSPKLSQKVPVNLRHIAIVCICL